MKIRIGTRGSLLALWQAEHVAGLIGKDRTEIVVIKTRGDRIQNVSFDKMEGKGFFTKEIEAALIEKRVDLAVHSLKDLPTQSVPELRVAAVPERENPCDLLLIRRGCADESRALHIRDQAVVGTSSLRRLAQLKLADPSVIVEPLRGNVNTRVRKLREGRYDAVVLAYAGIMRIGLDVSDMEVFEIPFEIFLPAPAQGALGLQIRADDRETYQAVAPLNHYETEMAVTAEREFLHHFGGGCHVPLGARATLNGGKIRLTGVVASIDGTGAIRESVQSDDPRQAGEMLALTMKQKGAADLL